MSENSVFKTKGSSKKTVHYEQPEFYGKFKCMGGFCPYSCCSGDWEIYWTQKEIDKVLKADCSDKLRKLMESSFVRNTRLTNTYNVIYKENERKDCPFLTEDRMCLIQRELGAEYLSNVCSIYPRKVLVSGDRAMRTCVMSCFEVLNMICGSEDSMKLVCGNGKLTYTHNDSDAKIAMHPELKYRGLLFDFFYDVISDNKYSVEDGIILGAMAANSLSKCIESKRYEHIPSLIEEFRGAFKDPANRKAVSGIKSNLLYKAGVCAKIVDFAVNRYVMRGMYDEDGSVNAARYLGAEKVFEEICAEKPFMLRNIALNMLFECTMPFFSMDITLFENYCYYAAAFAAIKMLGPAEVLFCVDSGNKLSSVEAFKCAVTYVSRNLFNSPSNIDIMLAVLKKFDCMSPAKLALLLK